MLEAICIQKMNHAFGSLKASKHCDHLNSSFLIPVKFSLTLAIALLRSARLRNQASIGVSGRRKKTPTDQETVIAPRIKKTALKC